MTPVDTLRAVLATHPVSIEYRGREMADALLACDRRASLLPRLLGHEVGGRWIGKVSGCAVGVNLEPGDLTDGERRLLRDTLWGETCDPWAETAEKDKALEKGHAA